MNREQTVNREQTAVLCGKKPLSMRIKENYELYLLVLPAVIYIFIFNYLPMAGIAIAFNDFKPKTGIFGSKWVGMEHFKTFFNMASFWSILRNTVFLSLYSLVAGFPLPIILALALNSCPSQKFKKVVQTVTYAPHFISVVVIVGMIKIFLAPSYGVVTNILQSLNMLDGSLALLNSPSLFPHLYVWSDVWASIGWSSIIYLGALSGVDPSMYESAEVDGANKFHKIIHIDLPTIMPTIVILLILNCGAIMNVGFEKVFLLQNGMNLATSEVISTYVYKVGIGSMQYSLSTAIGLFNSVINFVILVIVNSISRKVNETSLW